MTEPVTPDSIQAQIPGVNTDDIERLVVAVNQDLQTNGKASIARYGYYIVMFSKNGFTAEAQLAPLWNIHHAVVVEKFQQAGWFIRYMGLQQADPQSVAYAFALDPVALPESVEEKKRADKEDDLLRGGFLTYRRK